MKLKKAGLVEMVPKLLVLTVFISVSSAVPILTYANSTSLFENTTNITTPNIVTNSSKVTLPITQKTTTTAAVNTTSSPQPPSGLSLGQKIGIAIGAIVGILLVSFIFAIYIMKLRGSPALPSISKMKETIGVQRAIEQIRRTPSRDDDKQALDNPADEVQIQGRLELNIKNRTVKS